MNPILYRAFIGVIPYTFAQPSNSPRTMLHSPVKTPCIGVCSTGIGDSVCRGCKRFSHEVIDWNSYSQEQKPETNSYGMVVGMDFLSFWTCLGSILIPFCYMMTCPTYFHAVTATRPLKWLRRHGELIHGRTYASRLL